LAAYGEAMSEAERATMTALARTLADKHAAATGKYPALAAPESSKASKDKGQR